MSESALAIAGLYDHESETARRAPDWGVDEVFERPRPKALALAEVASPAPIQRRTVTITGHPGATALTTRQRRPGRTIDQRLESRPERIAMWAFGMGLLLIVIALATAPA